MPNTSKKFDTWAYIKRRIKELKGERVYGAPTDPEIICYTRRRIRELRQSDEAQRVLDKDRWGCYTVSTMGDDDGET